MQYDSRKNRPDYSPPLLANGDISMYLNARGTHDGIEKREGISLPRIWRVGVRDPYLRNHPLLSMGMLQETINHGDVDYFLQELHTDIACMDGKTLYQDGTTETTRAFVAHDLPLIVIRKSFSKETQLLFTYRLADRHDETETSRYITYKASEDDNGFTFSMKYDAYVLAEGTTCFFCDIPAAMTMDANAYSFSVSLAAQQEITLYLLFTDNRFEKDFSSQADAIRRMIRNVGYDGILKAHIEKWAAYYAEGYIITDDEAQNALYRCATYSLGAQMTRFSMPISLCDSAWEGRYFAFDEYFSHLALLQNGHFSIADRIPKFRAGHLTKMKNRAMGYPNGYPIPTEGREVWEALEDGEEASPWGFWYEHIFHLPNIVLGIWEYYQYTQDRIFLEETGYEVMYALCGHLLHHNIYRDYKGKTMVGRCTDLERLGNSVENPYMTTCSVICALRALIDASAECGRNTDQISQWNLICEELYRDLPSDGKKYIPALGCLQRSIAIFAGLYPYPCVKPDQTLQKASIVDFETNGTAFGNMYALGSGLSPWYAAWKAAAYAKLGDDERCAEAITRLTESRGCFDEIWEINEGTNIRKQPWFTTATGAFLSAAASQIVQQDGNKVFLFPSLPPKIKNVRFRLALQRFGVIEGELRNGKLFDLRLPSYKNLELIVDPKYRRN